jgi:hypothetical protein
MVIPGGASDMQYLLLVERPDGTTTIRRTLPVRFVPFTRDRANRDVTCLLSKQRTVSEAESLRCQADRTFLL